MTTIIPWNDGSGDNITLTYQSANLNQTVSVTSDENSTTSERQKTVTFKATLGETVVRKVLTVKQAAGTSKRYRLLQYIQGNGSAACKFPFNLSSISGFNSNNLSVTCEFSITSHEGWEEYWGAQADSGYTRFYMETANNSTTVASINSNNRKNADYATNYTYNSGFKTISIQSGKFYNVNSESTNFTLYKGSNYKNFGIMAVWKNNTSSYQAISSSGFRLKHLAVAYGTQYNYDFYPVEDTVTGKGGWYDVNSKTFLPSDTGTDFTKGPYDSSNTWY